ncbi:MAG: Lrp/AsnC family transcriptional regulator [Desulfarculaceae bacterium]|jgi:Lrp/AsnC family leucine-responsive transcriptional regulator
MDAMDKFILRALQSDARQKNADLARALEAAPSTVLERIRRLEQQGFFKGFRAVLDPAKLGYQVQALISVSLGQHTTDTIRPFERAVQDIPFVTMCYHVTGRFDYILQVLAKDLSHLGQLVKEQIASIPGVGKTETFIVYSEVKSGGLYPVDPEEAS